MAEGNRAPYDCCVGCWPDEANNQGVMRRQVSDADWRRLCADCADILRGIGPTQTRGTEPPRRAER